MAQTEQDDLAGDIAYVRALAEEGAHAPLVGGVFYVIWGGVIGAAAFVSWLNAISVITLGGLQIPLWVGAFMLGWALTFVFGARAGAKAGALTLGNKTANAVWFAVGVFMTSFWLGLMIVHDNFTAFGVPHYFLFNMMFPVAFGLYGVAFYATATAARMRWLKLIALCALAFSVLSLVFMATPHLALIGFIGIVTCGIIPGIVLMRREPSEIV